MKVLMIEDDDVVGRPIELWIERQGHTLFWCESVRDFFALKETDFDAVITDFQLGDGTGLTVLQGLSAKGSRCPVLLHSGNDNFQTNGHVRPLKSLADPRFWPFPVTVEHKGDDQFAYLERFFGSISAH